MENFEQNLPQSGEGADFVITRHSIKPKGEDLPSENYEGVSVKGEALARERARAEIQSLLEQAEPGTVMIWSGATELIRTKTTEQIYIDELKKMASQGELGGAIVITADDIPEKIGMTATLDWLRQQVVENPDKKIVIGIPLYLSGLEASPFLNKDGSFNEFTKKLAERVGESDPVEALEEWFRTGGDLGEIRGPSPEEVAKNQLAALAKLKDFARKYIADRPLVIGAVGHSFNLDALAVYLANNGKVDSEGFKRLGGQIIGETKPITLKNENGRMVMEYGEQVISLEGGNE